MTYVGESIGKKLARAEFWRRAALWRGDAFLHEDHLVLASQEGGDISVLKSMGVAPQRIWAVDMNSSAVEACSLKHPDVRLFFGDVGALARKWNRKFGVIFLDFCGWGHGNELRALVDVATVATFNGSVLGYAFMRGREPGIVMDELAREAEVEARFAWRFEDQAAELASGLPIDGRAQRIDRSLFGPMLARRRACLTLFTAFYQGRRSPMRIAAKWVYCEALGTKREAFRRRWEELGREWVGLIKEATQLAIDRGMVDGPDSLQLTFDGHAWEPPPTMVYPRDLATIVLLLDVADMLDTVAPGLASQRLNIRAARLAALRAHRTMGTYEARRVRSKV